MIGVQPVDHIREKGRNRVAGYLKIREDWDFAPSLTALAKQTAREYEGRFLLELIQNGYDAHPKDTRDGRILVVLDAGEGEFGVLYVANTGNPFTASNFDALCDIAQSDKQVGEGIGNKGIGFKSVLEVCDAPEVFSTEPSSSGKYFDGYCFGFAAEPDFLDLADGDEDTKDALMRSVSPLFLPVPRSPVGEWLPRFADRGYVTVVRLRLRSARASEAAERAIAELAESPHPVLLFLERLSELQIDAPAVLDDSPLHLTRTDRPIEPPEPESATRLSLTEVGLGDDRRYMVATRAISEERMREAIEESIAAEVIDPGWREWTGESPVQVAVRIDDGAAGDDGLLYCYLPMADDAVSPFAGHVNAPFFTKLARGSLRIDVPLNSFLLAQVADLVVDLIEVLKGMANPWRDAALVDLICWEKERSHLEAAFAAHGSNLVEHPLLPLLPDGRVFGSLNTTYTWARDYLNFLTSDLLGEIVEVDILVDRLDEDRADRLQTFAEGVVTDGLVPDASTIADWAEEIASWLHSKPFDANVWDQFYADLAASIDQRSVLGGRQLIFDDEGKLRSLNDPTDKKERRSPTIFFFPAREHGDDDDEVDLGSDFRLPSSLGSRMSFTHRDLTWHRQEGPRRVRTEARKLFDGDLIRTYRTRNLVQHVADVLKRTTSDRTRQDALGLAFRIHASGRYSQSPSLGDIDLQLPTRGGWRRAREALFSASWETRLARVLEAFIQASADVSAEIRDLGNRLLLAPQEWPIPIEDIGTWREMLLLTGVHDGMPTLVTTGVAGTRSGRGLTPRQLASQLPPQIAESWLDSVESISRPMGYPDYNYRIGSELHMLPGQADFELFGDSAKGPFAELIGAGLATWSDEVVGVRVTRISQGGNPDNHEWPTPLWTFLQGAPWVPMSLPGEGRVPRFEVPNRVWHQRDEETEPPRFAATTTKRFRARLNVRQEGSDRLRRLGARAWGDPKDAGDVVRHLGKLYAEGEIAPGHHLSLHKLYEEAWGSVVAQEGLPVFDPSTLAWLIASRGGELTAIDMSDSSDSEVVYVADSDDPLTADLLGALDVPLLDLNPRIGIRVGVMLEEAFQDRVRTLSSARTDVYVDGAELSMERAGHALIDVSTQWLSTLVICAVELTPNPFVRRSSRRLREIERMLARIQLVSAERIEVALDGRPVEIPHAFADAFPYQQGEDAAIASSIEPPLGWSDCARLAAPIMQLVHEPSSTHLLQLAAVQLEAIGASTQDTLQPEDVARALSLPESKVRQVIASVAEPVNEIRSWVEVIVFHFCGVDAAQLVVELEPRTEDDLLVGLESMSSCLPIEPREVIRRCTDVESPEDLMQRFDLGFEELNAALRGLGRPAVLNEEGQLIAFRHYVQANRAAISEALRTKFADAFRNGDELDEYVARRPAMGVLPESLKPDPGWLESFYIQPEEAMREKVDNWLLEVRAPHLGDVAAELMPIEEVTKANIDVVHSTVARLGPLLTAWCSSNGLDIPAVWKSEDPGRFMVVSLDGLGVLDFDNLTDSSVLTALERAHLLPSEMPKTLDPEMLGLRPEDISAAGVAAMKERQEREVESRTIRIDGRPFIGEPTAYDEIAQAVVASLGTVLLDTPFVTDQLKAPGRRRAKVRGTDTSAKPRDTPRRPTQQQKDAIGLVGELVAFEWLKRHVEGVTRESWKSTYSGWVYRDARGDDSLGYDFEVLRQRGSLFFEAKATSGERLEFELAESEVGAAQRYTERNRYRIIFVRNALDSEKRSVHLLPNPFSPAGREFYHLVGSGLKYRFEFERGPI